MSFTLDMYGLKSDRSIDAKIVEASNHTIQYSCIDTKVIACESKAIVYVPRLVHENYRFVLTFNTSVLNNQISDFAFTYQVISPNYTNFLLTLKYFCLSLSAVFLIFFELSIRRLKKERLVFEQKFVRVLAYLLLFFNDPIYALTILSPSTGSSFFSTLFVVTFFCALLLFWICSFERIYIENNEVQSKTLTRTKLIYILLLWIFSIAAYAILNREYLQDPSFDFNDEHSDAFNGLKITMIIILLIGLIWMLFGFAQIIKKYSTRIWRHRMFFLFSCYFILCYFLFLFTGSLAVYNDNGTRVMLVVGITNLYIWFMMVLYTPTDQSVKEAEQSEKISNVRETELQYGVLDESENNEGPESLDRSEKRIQLPLDPPSSRDKNDDSNTEKVIHNPDQIIFGIDNKEEDEEDKDKYPFEQKSSREDL